MNSIYIDANAANSKIIDSTTNNRWEYQINGGLSLPTGTNISVASSFINQKGIAGGSIEIDEDIEEELVYGYYVSDTLFGVPTQGDERDTEPDYEDAQDRVGLDLYAPFNFVQNYLNQFIDEGATDYGNAKWAPHPSRGRTENPMPLLTTVSTGSPYNTATNQNKFIQFASNREKESTNWSYAIPLLSKSTIKIKKGVYTLHKIADIITKQLNGLELPDNVAKTQFEEDKDNGNFDGQLTNNGFARKVKVEYSQAGSSLTVSNKFFVDGEEQSADETFDWRGGMYVRNHYFPKGSLTQVNDILNYEDKDEDLVYTSPFNFQLTQAQYQDYVSQGNSDTQAVVMDYFRSNVRALTSDDDVIPSVFAVRPSFFQKSIDYMKLNYASVILAPDFNATGAFANQGFQHFDSTEAIKPIDFAPSLFCWSSDITANQLTTNKGAQSEFCYIFENNALIPPVNLLNPATGEEGKGLFPTTMYSNSYDRSLDNSGSALMIGRPIMNHVFLETRNFFPNNAMTVGTTNFNISFDTSTSLFSLDHLHEPRRLPTYDKLGNKVDSPSSECYYIQRTVDVFKDLNRFIDNEGNNFTNYPELFYFESDAPGDQIVNNNDTTVNNLSTIAQRLTGVMMRNWAFTTAKKLRTVPQPPLGENIPVDDPDFPNSKITHYDDFLTFDEFFRTKAEAKEAWSQTIWAKLGFTYEQICSSDSYEKVKYYNLDQETLGGFTTTAGFSSTVIPQVSTQYANNKATADPTDGIAAFNAAVQYFNNADMNVPSKRAQATYIADPSDPDPSVTQVDRTYQYQNSFYDYAVMGAVETTGKDIQARQLPNLSKHGYFLITSNIGGNTDVVHDGSPIVLLDTVPKSNLANQDFIFNRNDLSHTLSNPVNLNSIQINILNPDLSNPTLNPNSSVLLRIDYPVQKETVLRQDVLDQDAIEAFEKQVQIELKNLTNLRK